MSIKQNETTSDQQVVNTSTKETIYNQHGEAIVKKIYSKTRFQIKNQGALIDRKLPTVLSPEEVESIASTRDKLSYVKNSTYKLVNSYLVDFKRNPKKPTEKIPLDKADQFRVGIYAVPQVHKLI